MNIDETLCKLSQEHDYPGSKRLRSAAETIIENTRDATRWPWLLILGFSLLQASRSIYVHYEGFDSLINALVDPLPLFLFILVFLPTFFRFYVGDHRLTELFYFQALESIRIDISGGVLAHILNRSKRILDQLGFFSLAVIFLFLGLSVSEPFRFFRFVGVLYLLNIVWLICSISLARKTEQSIKSLANSNEEFCAIAAKRYLSEMDLDMYMKRAPRIWLFNNIVCSALIIPVAFFPYFSDYNIFGLSEIACLSIMLVVATLNSFFDIYLTHRFYFPRLDVFLKRIAQGISDSYKGVNIDKSNECCIDENGEGAKGKQKSGSSQ